MNWLCNPLGCEDSFRAIDWLVEVNNCATKVTFAGSNSNRTKELVLKQSNLIEVFTTAQKNVVSEYFLTNLTSRHCRPDMTSTNKKLARHVEEMESNTIVPGREANYVIPNLLKKGMSEMHKVEFLNRVYLPDEDDSELERATVEISDLQAI